MSDLLFTMATHTTIRKRVTATVTGSTIREALNQELKANGSIVRIPADATVEFHVPGGADWSDTEIKIDDQHPIHISWETVEED